MIKPAFVAATLAAAALALAACGSGTPAGVPADSHRGPAR
jgi:hypothetical protein